MRTLVLSRSATIYTTRRLVEAARAAGHTVRVVDPARVEMHLDGHAGRLFVGGKEIGPTDVVIPRIGYSQTIYGLAVTNQLGLRGTPLLNSANAISTSRNKMRLLQLLVSQGVEVPATVMGRDPKSLKNMVRRVGGVPVLIKLLQGGPRIGVMVCASVQSMEAALEAMLGLGQDFIVQQYVRGERGKDVRALVVGGEVVAAVRRRAKAGRFHRTLRGGARFGTVELGLAHRRAAVAAARVVGLEVAAVGMMDVRGVPKVYEVDSSPGIREIEEVTGVDVAGAMIQRAVAVAVAAGRGDEPGHRPALARAAARR